MFQVADLFRADTPLSGPSWQASSSNIGSASILGQYQNEESPARINQACARAWRLHACASLKRTPELLSQVMPACALL